MTYLRKAARGQECQLRLMAICQGGTDTTVLAHIRRAGSGGIGIKPPDTVGIWCCHRCHEVLDGRAGNVRAHDSDILDGLIRTLCELDKQGILK